MSEPGAKRRNEFPADRVTIMISARVHAKVSLMLARIIKECAKEQCNAPSSSYSRVVNLMLAESFDKGNDKKIISQAKKGL